ncbi:MAG: proton-conducting transporter membrane subunit [candidate division WOR-3 bacterium]|nr:proton-conducting transporter membrane subunit [candidate division WOR-3 bacterium]
MIFLPLLIALPLFSAFVIPLLSKLWKPFAPVIGNITTFVLFIFSLYGIAAIQGFPMLVYKFGNWPPPIGIIFSFDAFSAFMVFVISIIVFSGALFATKYLNHYTGQWKFWTLYMLLTTGLMGISVTGDLFNMFVWIEISAIASYALVSFGIEAEELEASLKYMVMGEIAGMTLLLAIALIYAKTSTLNLADIALSFQTIQYSKFYWSILALLLFAFSVKAALVPFHFWLPDAHPAAPAPISSLLSGVFIKVLGVYTSARFIFNIFGLTRENAPFFFNILVGIGLLSIVYAGITALSQKDYKRLLGFSTISQVGYIMLGLGIGNFYGIAGAVLYILAHGISKALLFLTSGSVVYVTGERNIEKLGGLGESMPTTAWSFRFGALSLIGLPPLIGFFAKFLIALGAIKQGFLWLAIVAIGFSGVTLGYLLKIENNVYLKKNGVEAKEAPFLMRVAMVFLVILLLVLGIGYKPLMDFVIQPATDALLRGTEYINLILGGI